MTIIDTQDKDTRDKQAQARPLSGSSEERNDYRFDRLTLPLILTDMRFKRTDPAPGDVVQPFDLPTTQGGRFRSTDLGGPVLMVFGSLTCPLTEASGPGLNELHSRFGDRVRFVVVNVREAHPGEHVPQPQSAEDKLTQAAALRAHHRFNFDVAVDELDGTLHRAMSPKPNSAYLIDGTGVIRFRAQWANDTRGLERALKAMVGSRAPRPDAISRTVPNLVRSMGYIDQVLDRAGPQAKRDLWRSAPPMAAMASATMLLRPVSLARRGPVLVALMAAALIGLSALALGLSS